MQHHIDEFSVSDIRYTLSEVWRVVTNRRWHFVLPFFAVGTIALVASFWAPRKYTATTIIKREHDPVLASMMGKSWTEPYAEIRQRMAADISNTTFVLDVLSDMDNPAASPIAAENIVRAGSPSAPHSGSVRLTKEVSAGLKVVTLESSPNRDVIEIRLTMSEPTRAAKILAACRDRYMEITRKRASEVLNDVQRFFTAESERCRSKLSGLEKKIIEMEATYPGIDPSKPDASQSGQAALVLERIEIGRKQDELMARRLRLQAIVDGQCVDEFSPRGTPSELIGTVRNPRISELEAELAKLQQDLHESRTVRLMTEEHPTVLRLVKTIKLREEELAASPAMIPETSADDFKNAGAEGLTEIQHAAVKLENTDAEIMANANRLQEISRLTAEIDRRRVETADHREAYLKLCQQSNQLREELNGWHANLGPIGHVLAIENSNRGIHFLTLQDAILAAKPTSPNAIIVVAICLAIGAGVGVLMLLMAELLDRSFQTVRQLNTSLGIPVIESIDEILTEPARRRLILRRFVMLPAVTMAMGLTMSVVGAMAYLSLEHPESYERMRRLVGLG